MSEQQIKNLSPNLPLDSSFHAILATEDKNSELFVKSFQYQGENIATKHLGQIFGFFEIPDTQEDNAYIVNFLASVVKKEYFINPKRSATDSFEAALHKINLALTELVKQGNTAWLGKLNGVVSVTESNTFHFSVTGDASILLFREQQVTCISEGLADKDAALHPLKTFLEISSGALLPEDKVMITSPELFTICPLEILQKNAFRMDNSNFARFVRTALINELPLGVSIILDFQEANIQVIPKKKGRELREQSLEKLQNVFSGASFPGERKKAPTVIEEIEEEDVLEEEVQSEYTDQKTGHIYVQGDNVSHDFQEPTRFALFMQSFVFPTLAALSLSIKRASKKTRKQAFKQAGILSLEAKRIGENFLKSSKEKSLRLAKNTSKSLQEKIAHLKETSQKRRQEKAEESFEILSPELVEDFVASETLEVVPVYEEEYTDLPEEINTTNPEEKRQMALQKFSPHYKGTTRTKIPVAAEGPTFLEKIQSMMSALVKFALQRKPILGGIVLLVILIISITTLLNHDSEAPVSETPSAANEGAQEVTPAPVEAPSLSEPNVSTSWDTGEALLVVRSNEGTAVVTPKSIVFNGEALPFVADGTIMSATYMPDLKLVFLWSDKKELVSWSLVDQKFSANTLPLPANTTVSYLGSYLTYLYVLDNNVGTIYRFARTEGGFGEPTSWLRTPLAKESVTSLAVTDTIRVATTESLDQYLRGAKEKTLEAAPYQVLGLSNDRNFTLGVNTDLGKITIWNNDGNQVYTSTYSELLGVTAISYHEADKKLLVTKEQQLLEYNLNW